MPRQPGDVTTDRCTMGLRIDRALREWLIDQARREDRSMADIVNQALEEYRQKGGSK